ncbi:hypothetical protein DL767_006975 [Monosporascus sp. MG133]|nr:hypothetical protein DL767_006975 [Monosporascus sp. MG133]
MPTTHQLAVHDAHELVSAALTVHGNATDGPLIKTRNHGRLQTYHSDESWVQDDLFANSQLDRATAASGFLSPRGPAPSALGQLGPTMASAQGAAESTHGEAINTETTDADLDTSEQLAEFNLRILKLNRFLSKSREWTLLSPLPASMSTLADEMVAMTRCLLGIMERYTLSLHRRHHRRNQLSHSPPAPSSLEESPGTSSPTTETYDTGILLLFLSCRQRLLDMFKLVCVSLQSSSIGVDAVNNTIGGSLDWNSDATISLSNAQIIMHVELVTHLLRRFDNRQKELLSALGGSSSRGNGSSNPSNMYPDVVAAATARDSSSSTPPWPSFSSLLSQHPTFLVEKNKSGGHHQQDCVDVARLVHESMNATRSALDHHLSCVKLFLEGLDDLDNVTWHYD